MQKKLRKKIKIRLLYFFSIKRTDQPIGKRCLQFCARIFRDFSRIWQIKSFRGVFVSLHPQFIHHWSLDTHTHPTFYTLHESLTTHSSTKHGSLETHPWL